MDDSNCAGKWKALLIKIFVPPHVTESIPQFQKNLHFGRSASFNISRTVLKETP